MLCEAIYTNLHFETYLFYRVSKKLMLFQIQISCKYDYSLFPWVLQECNDAILNFNSISLFTHLVQAVLGVKSQSVLCRSMGI